MHPTVSLAFDCSTYNNISFVTKCKLKYRGIQTLNKIQGKLFLYKILQLYEEIAILKSENIGQGHHQTIDVYRKIVDIECRIKSMENNNKMNKLRQKNEQKKIK